MIARGVADLPEFVLGSLITRTWEWVKWLFEIYVSNTQGKTHGKGTNFIFCQAETFKPISCLGFILFYGSGKYCYQKEIGCWDVFDYICFGFKKNNRSVVLSNLAF